MKTVIDSELMMREFGQKIGRVLVGGEVLELVGDVGAGKTTFVKGLAVGLGIEEDVQSPSFTISRVYVAHNNLQLAHYDFYRLQDAGIMAAELYEAAHDAATVTVVEWADIVADVLPADRLTIRFESPTESTRQLTLHAQGSTSRQLLELLT